MRDSHPFMLRGRFSNNRFWFMTITGRFFRKEKAKVTKEEKSWELLKEYIGMSGTKQRYKNLARKGYKRENIFGENESLKERKSIENETV